MILEFTREFTCPVSSVKPYITSTQNSYGTSTIIRFNLRTECQILSTDDTSWRQFKCCCSSSISKLPSISTSLPIKFVIMILEFNTLSCPSTRGKSYITSSSNSYCTSTTIKYSVTCKCCDTSNTYIVQICMTIYI